MTKPQTTKPNLEAIKSLRERTSAALSDVKAALEASGGDEEKAVAWLREKGAAIAEKRQGRAAGEGRIEIYAHHDGRLGVLGGQGNGIGKVGVSDSAIALQFCKDVAMQIAAMQPKYIAAEDVPKDAGISADEKKSAVLLEQPFVKDASVTIGEQLKGLLAKTGEKVVIRRFVRFALGESVE